MSLSVKDPVTVLKNVGEKRAELYRKLGITDIESLLRLYPRNYIDFTDQKMVTDCISGENAVILGKVLKKYPPAVIRKGMVLYKLQLTDGISNINLTIFNNEHAYYQLKAGESYAFYGKYTGGIYCQLALQTFLPADQCDVMRPVYPLTEGLSNGVVAGNVQEALERYLPLMEESLPEWVIRERGLSPLQEALRAIHLPCSPVAREDAKERLAFEELFRLSVALFKLRGREREKTEVFFGEQDLSTFYASLPFTLTNAQLRAIGEILADTKNPIPMNRLLQGDVGSGKTMVAAAACVVAQKNGYQSAIMAPTEILATQHAETLGRVLSPLGVRVCLLTGSLTPKNKDLLKGEIAAGAWDVVVGTHALVQQSTSFLRLGLVVTDEQHRFGVRQRQILAQKGDRPHNLVMSATPIPRTLALLAYGDLDISILDELPKGRQPVETVTIHTDKRERALGFIKKALDEGRQAYIVCPLIEESESELTAAVKYKEWIEGQYFSGYRVGLLHGRMKPVEKDEMMGEFQAGKIGLLVSTTVVEVGVDVPNATIMMIENAERFGLSQLHQLRGRVGRGAEKSTCILVSDHEGEDNRHRLKVMKSTTDGFIIAREDLKLRGAGDFFGERQSGMPSLGLADLFDDTGLFQEAQAMAKLLLSEDPDLEKPENTKIRLFIEEIFVNNEYGLN